MIFRRSDEVDRVKPSMYTTQFSNVPFRLREDKYVNRMDKGYMGKSDQNYDFYAF